MNPQDPVLNLSLSVSEINLVLNAMGNLPHNQVRVLIDKVTAQAQEQLVPKHPTVEKPSQGQDGAP